MPSLAELRASKPKSRPERALTLSTAPHLVAEVQALQEELNTLPTAPPSDDAAPPRRIGVNPEPPRAREIRTRMGELLEEMGQHEGVLRVRAVDDGAWRLWVNEHPAREEGEPGHKRDDEVAGGYCNADDLIEDLGTYAYSWDGEELAAGDWDILRETIAGADLKLVATAVVTMQESRLDFPSWRSALSANLQRSNDSASPES